MILKVLFFFVLTLNALFLNASILKRGNRVEPECLDPHKIIGFYEAQIIHDLFEGLVAYGPEGEILPALAEKWEVASDGTEYTFYLRDARWSNGEEITAKDVVYSFKRLLDPETACPNNFMFHAIKNAEAISSGKLKDLNQLGVVARSRDTVVITLNAPTSYFLNLLAHRAAVILPQKRILEAQEDQSDWATPGAIVTNGPYDLEEWVPLSHIKLKRSETYWDKQNVGIGTVYHFPIEDKNQEFQRFKTKDLDMTSDIPLEQVAIAKKLMKDAYHEYPSLLFYFLCFNMNKSEFKDNLKLRQALSMSIDRDLLIKSILRNSEIPAYSIVPNGMTGYTPEQLKYPSQAQRFSDARNLYKEAGYDKKTPLKLEILYNSDSTHKRNLIAISGMWKDVFGEGIEVNFKEVEWKTYLQMRNEGTFAMARSGWIGDYLHPITFLQIFSSQFSSQNPSKYKNPEFEDLLDRAMKAISLTGAFNFLKQAEKLVLDDLPIIPLYHGKTKRLVDPRLDGYKDNVIDIHRSKYFKWKN